MKNRILTAVLLIILTVQTGCTPADGPVSGQEGVLPGQEALPGMEAELPGQKKVFPEQEEAQPGQLREITICIDPGHQAQADLAAEPSAPEGGEMKAGTTAGTRGVVTGAAEYEFNLELGLRLKSLLEQEGALVVMTRTSHDVSLSNIERAQIANNLSADLFIRIHADSVDDSNVRGVSVLYPGDRHISDQIMLEASRKAAEDVLDSIMEAVRPPRGKIVERDDLTGFNWSTVPVILVEAGFMSNPEEDRLLADDKYRLKLAEGIAQGVIKFFEDIKERQAGY